MDDDETYRYATARELVQEGFRVRECRDFEDALQAIEAGERVSFLLADIIFPQGKPHGIAAALMVRNRLPKLPIAFMTAWPEFLDGKLTHGIGEVFMKPVDARHMAEHIRRAIESPGA